MLANIDNLCKDFNVVIFLCINKCMLIQKCSQFHIFINMVEVKLLGYYDKPTDQRTDGHTGS